MMILNELTLRRFRIHEQLNLKFESGVTGIVGRNGTGKSSIIEAIGFLFTGEGDDPKDQIITAGQSGTAYVRGKFTLNGKEGVIERSLDTSRVMLEYDGHKLIKASEVKELWAKLLQVDGHIFQHVIMAKQKKIPELFSGETAVREKAFQRIFMVPNTERLRSMIWDNYIKTCPPPLPEDDLYAIDQQLARLGTELTPKQEKLAILGASILNDAQMMAVVNYTEFYNRCMQDAEKRPKLEEQLGSLRTKKEELLSLLQRAAEQLRDVPEDFSSKLEQLKRDKERHRNFVLAVAEATRLREQLLATGTTIEAAIQAAAQAEADDDQARLNQNTLGARLTALRKEIDGLTCLTGATTCPTCHQPITNIESHLFGLRAELVKVTDEFQAATRKLAVTEANLAGQRALVERCRTIQASIDAANRQAEVSRIDFNEETLTAMLAESQRIQQILSSMQQYENSRVQADASIQVVEEQLRHLVTYTGNASPAEELALMQEVLHRHRLRTQEITALEKEVAQLQMEIQLLNQRRDTSVANHEKNLSRMEYNNKLRMAYDVLHTSQFPRRLVQTYGAVVEEELQQQLQRFDLPYQARINEDFRIIITKDGHPVPRLSGGQEMVVGLCLRLALHSMFSQAFPMLIIDEGTTHLDEENKKLYFQCINDLKTDKVIQQLIIIDHSSLLTDAVDHVIRL
ncbi:SMC family ATPase [Candidatus Dependentiae bacterium]|nr:MAG: SMC family ATPase [Candidatus Dependentiae bacterium]